MVVDESNYADCGGGETERAALACVNINRNFVIDVTELFRISTTQKRRKRRQARDDNVFEIHHNCSRVETIG